MRKTLLGILLGMMAAAAMGEATTLPSAVLYHHRNVSTEWIDQQYQYFKDKIADVDGKFYDVGRQHFEPLVLSKEPAAIGDLVLTDLPATLPNKRCRSVRKLDAHSIIAQRPAVMPGPNRDTRPAIFFRVEGFTTPPADGTPFYSQMICIGKADVDGQKVQNFKVFSPISKADFVSALNSGFELVQYRKVHEKEVRGGYAGGFIAMPGKAVDVEKIEEFPVP